MYTVCSDCKKYFNTPYQRAAQRPLPYYTVRFRTSDETSYAYSYLRASCQDYRRRVRGPARFACREPPSALLVTPGSHSRVTSWQIQLFPANGATLITSELATIGPERA